MTTERPGTPGACPACGTRHTLSEPCDYRPVAVGVPPGAPLHEPARLAADAPTLCVGGGKLILLTDVSGPREWPEAEAARRLLAFDALLAAARSARALLSRLGGTNHDPEYSELVIALAAARS